MSNKTPCANTQYLNEHQARIEHEERSEMLRDELIDDNVAARLACLQPHDMQALLVEVGALTSADDTHPNDEEKLFNEVAQHVATYFTNKTAVNAGKIGIALATFLAYSVRCEEADNFVYDE